MNLLERADLVDHVTAATHTKRGHAGPAFTCQPCHEHAVVVVNDTVAAHHAGQPLIQPAAAAPEPETVGCAELVDYAGLTYRVVDYWSRKGWLRAANADPGSGRARRYPVGELLVAKRMAALVAADLSPEAAHTVARAGGDTVLGGRVRVTVEAVPG